MRFSVILLLTGIMFSCNTDKSLERRITALERRVATLEEQAALSGNSAMNQGDRQVIPAKNIKEMPTNVPKFDFEHTDFNFGTVKEGEMVEHVYKFKNTGNAPLIVSKATASCGCTVPSWPKKPILPGQTSEIQVRFNSTNKPNQQVKTITIEANTVPELTKLQLSGFVVPKSQSK